MWIVSAPISVQFEPSADSYAVNVSPLRVSLTQCGDVDAEPAVLTLSPPATARRWNATPFECETSTNACGDPGSNESRIITPPFTHGETSSTFTTRAVIV